MGILKVIFGKRSSKNVKATGFTMPKKNYSAKSKAKPTTNTSKDSKGKNNYPPNTVKDNNEQKVNIGPESSQDFQENKNQEQNESDNLWIEYCRQWQDHLDEESSVSDNQGTRTEEHCVINCSEEIPTAYSIGRELPSLDSIKGKEWLESIQIVSNSKKNRPIEFYCEIKRVKIFCHSVYLDKLSDLTKFIILSVSQGKNKTEIETLTQMGTRTIEEEIRTLEKGGVIASCSDSLELTELGNGYAHLISLFGRYSIGIKAQLNTYSDIIGSRTKCFSMEELDPMVPRISRRLNYLLLKNDNYSNSLDYVKQLIYSENINNIPIMPQVLNSLYTTIYVEHNNPMFEHYILNEEIEHPISQYAHADRIIVPICIPVKMYRYRVRYIALDSYRAESDVLSRIYTQHMNLLSKEGQLIVERLNDEKEYAEICIFVNAYSGCLLYDADKYEMLSEVPEDTFILNERAKDISIKLYEDRLGRWFNLSDTNEKNYFFIQKIPIDYFRVDEKVNDI